MNPVAMHEVNKARHQDLQRGNDARRRASGSDHKRRGLVKSLLAKLRRLAGWQEALAGAAAVEQAEGPGTALRDGT
jgi:hypothetical protein